MKRWELICLSLVLLLGASLIYSLHYLIFRDLHHIFIFFLSDMAFLFIEVLLVVLILTRLLEQREKQVTFQRLNMISGAFFNEVGTRLLKMLMRCMRRCPEISTALTVSPEWTGADFVRAGKEVARLDARPDCADIDLNKLKKFLGEKRSFLLQLLTNPNILEHGGHSDTLWAIFHLSDELEARETLGGLPESDMEHLAEDLQRAYKKLAAEWLGYMEHLQYNYPFLFSLAVRTNPFLENVCIYVGPKEKK